MEREKLFEDVVSQIRACIVSTKGKTSVEQIKRDFKLLMGYNVPFSQLGYNSIDQFLRDIPTLATSVVNGQLMVDAKTTEKSSHISSMVNKQKEKKKRSFKPKTVNRHFHAGAPIPQYRQRKPSTYNRFKKNYASSSRVAQVSHNQFVNIPTFSKTSKVSSRLNSFKTVEQKKETEQPQTKPIVKVDVEASNCLLNKTKQRIIKRMADVKIDSNDTFSNGVHPQTVSHTSPTERSTWSWANQDEIAEKTNGKIKVEPSKDVMNSLLRPSGNPLADLENFVTIYNLEKPEIKTMSRKVKKNKPPHYDCKIKIGTDSTQSSYPGDYFDEMSAKKAAAEKVLIELRAKFCKRRSLLISDVQDILERIPAIVILHRHGIWNWQIEEDYEEKFKEQLPVNWLEVIDTIPYILVLPCMNKFVLKFCIPGEKETSSAPILFNVSVPSNTVKFDDKGLLLAEITCVVSAGEIWCRQISSEESDDFIRMLTKMEAYYGLKENAKQPDSIDVGGYYIALYDNIWSRVRVFDVQDDLVNCFCIDSGDELRVRTKNLFRLERQFAREQAQAFVCRLLGVEELYEASKSSESLHSLLDEIVRVQIDPNQEDDKSDPNDPALPVVLYNFATGADINEQIITHIGIETCSPTLNAGAPTEVYVSHIEQDGTIYVQVHSRGFEQLCTVLYELEKNIVENKLQLPREQITQETSNNELYFTQFGTEGKWSRAQIIDWSPDKKYAQLLLVDTGETRIITVNEHSLYALKGVSDVINKFPYQAIRAKMALKVIPENFVKTAKNLLSKEQSVLLKVVSNAGDIPMVELFKRAEPDNVLFSVNTAIMAETEFKKLGDGNNNSSKQSVKLQRLISLNQFDDSSKNVPSTGSLNCPPLPALGNFLDIFVPCAVHPHNFFVQRNDTRKLLNKLMLAIQDRYKDVAYSPLEIQDILPGKIYASRHEDGIWYRTSVIKVIHAGSISVFYCDFGYYANLTLQQLVPLDFEFMDLPYQAIKAKVADIQPKDSKWSMDDCKFFEKLVCRKIFVSILMGIEKDILYRSDIVLNLKIIDTLTKKDIHIDKVLIEKGIAIESHSPNTENKQ